MRDYKGSGSFTLRKRRRFPRGLLGLLLLILAVAIAAFLLLGRGSIPGLPASDKSSAAAKPASGRDIIPLKIPGQTPKQDSGEES